LGGSSGKSAIPDLRDRAREEDRARGRLAEQVDLGDNLLVMGSLLDEFAGKIDLVYIDPPLTRDPTFPSRFLLDRMTSPVPGKDRRSSRGTLSRRLGRGPDSYLCMMSDRLRLLHDS